MAKIKLFFSENWIRLVACIMVLSLMVCSMTFFAKKFTNPQTYVETIQSIDEKKLIILGVSAAIAGSATLLAAVPDDATTPLAEELTDLSSYLVIVVCVLVLEKSLLTVFGSMSCYVLFPLACAFAFAFIIKKKQVFIACAIKFAVLALALLSIVPFAMKLSDYIYDVNQVSIEQDVETIVDSTETESAIEITPDGDQPWYTKLWDKVTSVVNDTVSSVTTIGKNAIDTGKHALNKFTDAVSVFIIAYCVIPVFVVFLFLWLLKILFGININVDCRKFNLQKLNRSRSKSSDGCDNRIREEQ